MQQFITDRLPEIQELCRAHHVLRMTVFGSAVRDDFDPETSDVDVRVEFRPGVKPRHTWGQLELQEDLQVLLNRNVDLLDAPIRNPYLRREIEGSEVTIFAA